MQIYPEIEVRSQSLPMAADAYAETIKVVDTDIERVWDGSVQERADSRKVRAQGD